MDPNIQSLPVDGYSETVQCWTECLGPSSKSVDTPATMPTLLIIELNTLPRILGAVSPLGPSSQLKCDISLVSDNPFDSVNLISLIKFMKCIISIEFLVRVCTLGKEVLAVIYKFL